MEIRMKEARKLRKLTLKEVANMIHVSESAVSNFERGRNNPSGPTLALFCDALNISETWLRTGEGEMEVKPPENIVDRLASEYRLGPGKVALLRAAARVIEEFPEETALRLIADIMQELRQAVPASESVPIPQAAADSELQARLEKSFSEKRPQEAPSSISGGA